MTSAPEFVHSPLIKALDLDAKVALLTGATAFKLPPEPAIGLREIRLSDGPAGVLFPDATLLAATWSTATAYEAGRLLAEEALAQQIHVVLGPTVNLHPTLRGGRLAAYSEDPLLTGRLAAAYVRGLQDGGVGACLRHLMADASEPGRHAANGVTDEAALRELYLLPFEIAVTDAGAWSMMAAGTGAHDVAATGHRHITTEVVKGEWGYPGLIVPDGVATPNAVSAANGGRDPVTGPDGPRGAALAAAVRCGEVDETVLDDHLARLLLLAERVGALGDQPADGRHPAPDGRARKEQLKHLAAQGITVLRNLYDTLPLNREQTVALIGRHAVETADLGGGSAQVDPPYQVSVAEGVTAALGERVTVVEGAELLADAVRAAAAADVAVVVVGDERETPPAGRPTRHLPGAQDALVEAVAGAARRTVVVVNAATSVLMPWLPRVHAVLWAGLPGQEGGHAVAAALLGDIEPAGRLVTTFPAGDGESPGRPLDEQGTYAGYRGCHAGRAPEPAFWLGHGLGYGRWDYRDARLVTGDSPAVTVTVANTGRRTSREVVQVYFRPAEPDQPVRLVGWKPVTVAPGESARVLVPTDRRMWRRWDTSTATWTRLAPGGDILIARGLGDIRATLPAR